MFLLILILFVISSMVVESLEPKQKEFYYLPAEILEQKTDGTIFCSEKGAFKSEKINLDKDTIYLLTMDSKLTATNKDDEICVIWEVVD